MLYKRNKRHFFRFLCMLMLLLVHLDSYGYDFIGSLQTSTTESALSVLPEASFSSDELQIEWSNPDYRSHSTRPIYTDYTTLHPDIVLSYLLKAYTRNVCPQSTFPWVMHKGIAVYLSHCLFII